LERIEKRLEKLEHKVFGNGEVGMDEVLRANTAAIARLDKKVDAVKESVDALRQERRDDLKRREGAVAALGWLKWALGVLATVIVLGGGLGLWRVNSQWETVQQQLQRLPGLPE
jgi:cytochrome c-type biogenesis protein CcmH/NrfG